MKNTCKTTFLSLILFLLTSQIHAQTEPIAESKFQKEIMPEVSKKLAELEKMMNSGQIKDEEELTSKMYDIIYDIESKSNPVPNPGWDSIAVEDQQVASMEMEDTTDYSIINKMPKKKKSFSMNTVMKLGFATAFEGKSNPADVPDINFWRSAMLEVGLNFRNALNSNGTVGVNYGINYLFYDFDTKNQHLNYAGSKDKIAFTKDDDLKDSDFGASYLSIPVGIDFKISKLRVDVGGYGAILLNGFVSLEKKTALGETVFVSSYAKYNMNSFIYGARLGLGFKNIGLYANYNLNSMFKDTYNLNPFSVGIRFGF